MKLGGDPDTALRHGMLNSNCQTASIRLCGRDYVKANLSFWCCMAQAEKLWELENPGHVKLHRACSPWHCQVCFAAVKVPWWQAPGVLHAEVQLLRRARPTPLQLPQTILTLHNRRSVTLGDSSSSFPQNLRGTAGSCSYILQV